MMVVEVDAAVEADEVTDVAVVVIDVVGMDDEEVSDCDAAKNVSGRPIFFWFRSMKKLRTTCSPNSSHHKANPTDNPA